MAGVNGSGGLKIEDTKLCLNVDTPDRGLRVTNGVLEWSRAVYTSTINLYCNPTTGVDDWKTDNDRGKSSSKPFKTIMAAIDWIKANVYAANFSYIQIFLADGDYSGQGLINVYGMPNDSSLVITGTSDSSKVIIPPLSFNDMLGCYSTVRNVTIKYTSAAIGQRYMVHVSSYSRVGVHDAIIDCTGAAGLDAELIIFNVNCYSTLSTNTANTNNIVIKLPSTPAKTFALANIQHCSQVYLHRTTSLQGSATGNYMIFIAHKSYLELMSAPAMTMTGTYTGPRYRIVDGSVINSNSRGATFFPGTTDGTADKSSFYI